MDEELEESLHGFCGDIKKFTREKDYKSALILVSGLREYILDLKKKR